MNWSRLSEQKFLKMYPIDTAIVTACHSGQGGTGDVAILTAANRMQLMPFAQIATRIDKEERMVSAETKEDTDNRPDDAPGD